MFFVARSRLFLKTLSKLRSLRESAFFIRSFIFIIILSAIDYFTSLLHPLKQALVILILPVLEFFSVVEKNIENTLSISQYVPLNENERQRLKKIEDKYELLKGEYFKLQIEVQNLREILKSPAEIQSAACIAQVIGTHMTQTKMNLTINKGSDYGLKVGQVVIAPKGLVGRISEVWPKYSLIQTLLDNDLKVPAQLSSTKEKGLIVYYSEGTLAFKYLSNQDKPKIGEIVHTTRFQELYPENLIIGKIVEYAKEIPLLKPSVDIARLDYVMVLQ